MDMAAIIQGMGITMDTAAIIRDMATTMDMAAIIRDMATTMDTAAIIQDMATITDTAVTIRDMAIIMDMALTVKGIKFNKNLNQQRQESIPVFLFWIKFCLFGWKYYSMAEKLVNLPYNKCLIYIF